MHATKAQLRRDRSPEHRVSCLALSFRIATRGAYSFQIRSRVSDYTYTCPRQAPNPHGAQAGSPRAVLLRAVHHDLQHLARLLLAQEYLDTFDRSGLGRSGMLRRRHSRLAAGHQTTLPQHRLVRFNKSWQVHGQADRSLCVVWFQIPWHQQDVCIVFRERHRPVRIDRASGEVHGNAAILSR